MDTRAIAKEYRLSHWAGIMQERISSGVSIKAYCQTAGICENVYYYWQKKLREAACQELLPSLNSSGGEGLVPRGWAICKKSEVSSQTTGTVTIEIGQCRVSVGTEISAEQLEKVCRVLMSLC